MPERNLNQEKRVAQLEAILKHLRLLEKDTGRIIDSLHRERHRIKASMMIDPLQEAQNHTRAKRPKAGKRR